MLMTTHKKTPLSILYTHTKMNAPLRIESRRVVQGVRDDETTTLYGASRASRVPNTPQPRYAGIAPMAQSDVRASKKSSGASMVQMRVRACA
jgi:hypothetical protein